MAVSMVAVATVVAAAGMVRARLRGGGADAVSPSTRSARPVELALHLLLALALRLGIGLAVRSAAGLTDLADASSTFTASSSSDAKVTFLTVTAAPLPTLLPRAAIFWSLPRRCVFGGTSAGTESAPRIGVSGAGVLAVDDVAEEVSEGGCEGKRMGAPLGDVASWIEGTTDAGDGVSVRWRAVERVTRSDTTKRADALRLLDGAEEAQRVAPTPTLPSGWRMERPDGLGTAGAISIA